MEGRSNWLAITVLALLAGCAGSSTETANPATGSLATAGRTAPFFGPVPGLSSEQQQPGVDTTSRLTTDGLAIELAQSATLSQVQPDGSAAPVATLVAGGEITLPRPGQAGEAVYYEARRADGSGNKVTLGISDFPPGTLPCPVLFLRCDPRTDTGAPMMTFRNLGHWNDEGQVLMRLDPDGKLTQVLAITGRPMQDFEASYDARKILFTMREFSGDDMEIFEMNADGTNLTQLTHNETDDGEPTYLPDGRILFTSKRLGLGDFYDAGTEVPQLYVLDPFTGSERLVHIAADGVFNPSVAANGQIYFTSWDTRINLNGPRFNRFVIWRMDPDGTDAFPVFGSHIARDDVDCFIDPREAADGMLYAVHTNFDIPGIGRAHHENFGAGSVIKLDPLGNPDFPTYKYITPRAIVDSGPANTLGRYKFPVPLPGGGVLVSYAPGKVWSEDGDTLADAPDWGLYKLSDDGSKVKLCDAPGLWEIGAVPLLARAVPPVIPDITLPAEQAGQEWGEFACENIFDRAGDMRQGHPRPEDGPWKLRVMQGLRTDGVPTGDPGRLEFDGRNFPVISQGPVIGEYPVASDGSFRIRIPADTPITWELVDGFGRVAVRERMFNMVRPGETRTCAGCHAAIDIKHNINLSAKAFKPNGEGFSDLRGLFEDFATALVDNVEQ